MRGAAGRLPGLLGAVTLVAVLFGAGAATMLATGPAWAGYVYRTDPLCSAVRRCSPIGKYVGVRTCKPIKRCNTTYKMVRRCRPRQPCRPGLGLGPYNNNCRGTRICYNARIPRRHCVTDKRCSVRQVYRPRCVFVQSCVLQRVKIWVPDVGDRSGPRFDGKACVRHRGIVRRGGFLMARFKNSCGRVVRIEACARQADGKRALRITYAKKGQSVDLVLGTGAPRQRVRWTAGWPGDTGFSCG